MKLDRHLVSLIIVVRNLRLIVFGFGIAHAIAGHVTVVTMTISLVLVLTGSDLFFNHLLSKSIRRHLLNELERD